MPVFWLLLINAMIIALATIVLWRVAVQIGDVSFIDAWWPSGMVLVAAASYLQTGGSGPHALLLTTFCALWGVRLALYLYFRWRRNGPDRRYTEMLDNARTERGWGFAKASLLLVFAIQAPLQWIVCLPVQLGQIAPTIHLGAAAWVGTAAALFGIGFEAVGDWQLAQFKADPENRGKVMDRGLWRYTRHPNYFGEACLWWGLYLIAAETGVGAWSLPGPLLITVLLVKGSGVPTVEGHMRANRPGYEDYVRRTSSFVPWFPKRS